MNKRGIAHKWLPGGVVREQAENALKQDEANSGRAKWAKTQQHAKEERAHLRTLLGNARKDVEHAQTRLDDVLAQPPIDPGNLWAEAFLAQALVPDAGTPTVGELPNTVTISVEGMISITLLFAS